LRRRRVAFERLMMAALGFLRCFGRQPIYTHKETDMRKLLAGALIIVAGMGTAGAAIRGEEVQYKVGNDNLKGYVAYDDAVKGARPGVIVVHEWWGHNEHARNSARKLAALGYTAIAVDMYGDGKTAAHPDDAKKFSGALTGDAAGLKARFEAARDVLRKNKTVDGKRLAAIGYCMGGYVVLEMARAGQDLKGVASFHGNISTGNPAQAGKVKARVLVMNGADDPFVKPETVEAFKKEMETAKVGYKFVNYPGAKHSFTNPDADANARKFDMAALAYNAIADNESWAELERFLKEVFKK
jgi:dienelactone hydrolase